MAVEDEYIRRELQDSTSFCNSFWVRAVGQSALLTRLTQPHTTGNQ